MGCMHLLIHEYCCVERWIVERDDLIDIPRQLRAAAAISAKVCLGKVEY